MPELSKYNPPPPMPPSCTDEPTLLAAGGRNNFFKVVMLVKSEPRFGRNGNSRSLDRRIPKEKKKVVCCLRSDPQAACLESTASIAMISQSASCLGIEFFLGSGRRHTKHDKRLRVWLIVNAKF